MRVIAGLGLMVLLPCALLLDSWAAQGAFGLRFYVVQGVELVAGAVNLSLMGLNLRDGLRLAGGFRVTTATITAPPRARIPRLIGP